jgi:hypothetical protein
MHQGSSIAGGRALPKSADRRLEFLSQAKTVATMNELLRAVIDSSASDASIDALSRCSPDPGMPGVDVTLVLEVVELLTPLATGPPTRPDIDSAAARILSVFAARVPPDFEMSAFESAAEHSEYIRSHVTARSYAAR